MGGICSAINTYYRLLLLLMVVDARPSRQLIAADLDALRRSIDQLRQSVGDSVFSYEVDLVPSVATTTGAPSITDDVIDSTTGQPSVILRKRPDTGDGASSGILNIKAGIRTVSTGPGADEQSIIIDETVGDGDTVADEPTAPVRQHPHRHHQQRNGRRRRKGCPTNKHGRRRIMCPSKSSRHYDVCITAEQLCDDVQHCPGGEDEHATTCLFYRTVTDQAFRFYFCFQTKEHLKHIYNTVLALADHVVKQDEHQEL